jgi:hypothetical protein
MENQTGKTTKNDEPARCAVATGSAKSPADILLWRVTTTVPTRSVIEGMTDLEIEKRAYVCPLCGQSEQYLIINGNVVKGCGMVSCSGGGVKIERCTRWQCVDEAKRRVESAMQNVTAQTRAADNL